MSRRQGATGSRLRCASFRSSTPAMARSTEFSTVSPRPRLSKPPGFRNSCFGREAAYCFAWKAAVCGEILQAVSKENVEIVQEVMRLFSRAAEGRPTPELLELIAPDVVID